MKHFVDYLRTGKPIIALRTSTHAFAYARNTQSQYAKYDWQSKEWPGGFGQQVLGETWVSHHGNHGKESTRGLVNEEFKNHPILRDVADVWGPTDVYTVSHLPKDANVLVWGQVLSGMKPSDPPVEGAKNQPLMPLVWVRSYFGESGKPTKIVATTMGAARSYVNDTKRVCSPPKIHAAETLTHFSPRAIVMGVAALALVIVALKTPAWFGTPLIALAGAWWLTDKPAWADIVSALCAAWGIATCPVQGNSAAASGFITALAPLTLVFAIALLARLADRQRR